MAIISISFNRCIKLSEHQKAPSKKYQKLSLLLISIIGKKFCSALKRPEKKLNNKKIALDIMLVPYNTEKIGLTYK